MKYKLLGKSGLRVSEICLGTMTFGEDSGAVREESRSLFDAFVERGGNFVDTGNSDTAGVGERLLGQLLGAERERFVVATKTSLRSRRDDPNAGNLNRKNIIRSLETSLKRLDTDYVDLYWVQGWDTGTPVEEVMRALDDLVRAGKVLYVGVSESPAWIVSQANTVAQLRGWSPFVALQVEYSLLQRTVERDLLPMAQAFELAVLAWGTLGGGILSGKYDTGGVEVGEMGLLQLSGKNAMLATSIREIARELNRTAAQVAINWVRQQRGGLIPIVGSRTAAQAIDNFGCLEFTLSDHQLDRLSQADHVELGFPYDFLALEPIQTALHGDTAHLLARPRTSIH